jgi:hypothetical protein
MKDVILITTNETHQWLFVAHIFTTVNQVPGERLEKNPLLNEVYVNCMGEKSTRNGNYVRGQKEKICVGIH